MTKEPLTLSSLISKRSKLDSLIARRGDYENEYIFAYSGDHVCSYSDDRLISYSIAEGVRRLEVFDKSHLNVLVNCGSTIEKAKRLPALISKTLRRISKIEKD